jgi:diketogulonate reductase-like aldo/keto reductase
MKFRKLGKTGEKIPALGLGTFGMGGIFSPDHGGDRKAVELLRKAIGMGYTLIDTAEMYGGGHSEELVGEAIKGMDRGKLFIVSKVPPEHAHFIPLINSAKKSMERLGTTIDLYLIHMPPRCALKETIRGLEKVVDMGIARHIGVSNFGEALTLEALQLSKKHEIVVNQSELNLAEQNLKLLDLCQEVGVTFMAYRPLGQGDLFKHPKWKELKKIGKKHRKTAVQTALRWVLDTDAVTIVKSSNLKHLKENLGSLGWELGEEWEGLRDSFLSEK